MLKKSVNNLVAYRRRAGVKLYPRGQPDELISGVAKPHSSRYTALTCQLTEYIRRIPMLYCEIFNVSHTFGDRASSSVIRIVLR
ncbi:hypothetical protein PKO51_00560 [Yokenella regensburgei]|jgi:hypothetical protein|uniref:hypothetical protein n=1 Tax=Yokenella regensburgei TaxID=158877 RepID=UPI0027D99DD4|nr:hypothetical protein [Yokenella regensburgei]MDQ4427869.1 hypothetical protein [Yokenella regensburgei]